MVEVRRSTIVNAPLEEVWAVLRDFNGHEHWHPIVSSSAIEDEIDADQVGAVRNFQLSDGGTDSRAASRSVGRRSQLQLLHPRSAGILAQLRRACSASPGDARQYLPLGVDRVFRPTAGRTRPAETIRCRGGHRRRLSSCFGFARWRSPRRPAAATTPRPVSAVSGMDATAVILTRYGGPEVLAAQKVLVAIPGAGEARIRQTAIGVNFIDVYCRRGSFDLVTPPAFSAWRPPASWKAWGPASRMLSPAIVSAMPARRPAPMRRSAPCEPTSLKLPHFLTDDAAASMLLKGITAGFLLHDVYAVQPGDIVLVHAAAAGRAATVPMGEGARAATVIGSVSSDSKAE